MTRNAFVQTFLILLISGAVGLAYNAVRSDNGLRLSRNYFKVLDAPNPGGFASSQPDGTKPESAVDDLGGAGSEPVGLQHNFISVSLDEVVDLYLSDAYGLGEVVFVDARDTKNFDESHIPGAIHIDRYNSDKYIADARARLDNADTIVVYCGGGECEDSIFLATELVELRGVPYDSIRLFEGGMMAWEGDELEVEGSRVNE